MSSGTPPAMVSTATLTIARGSIRRYLSRSGSSTQDASGSPSSSGTAAPPVPTITLAMRSGCAAAAKRAAGRPAAPAGADDHARDALGMCRRREQGGRGPDIGRDDVRPAELGLGDEPDQEAAHRSRGQEVVDAFGRAEAGQVDGEQAGVL